MIYNPGAQYLISIVARMLRRLSVLDIGSNVPKNVHNMAK